MKKILLSLAASLSICGINAQTYTDITPAKFDFNKYEVGALDNFWDTYQQVGHAPAGSATDPKGVITVAQAADFTDGYAYFYFNQPTQPNNFTQIVEVEGVGNVLQFGDAGMSAGFGGFYFVPTCAETEGMMRTTFIFRALKGENASNTGAGINVGVRNTLGEGPDLAAVTYTQLQNAAQDGKWFKATIEYNPTYALRFNFAQLIWGDNVQVAGVKFETMTDVPEDYEPVKEVVSGTPEELGIEYNPGSGEEPEEPGELTYTNITPAKFDFAAYEVGALDNFWNTCQQVNHAVAGNATDPKGVITMAQEADFTDGYAYFYFNQPAKPNEFTQIAEVDGVGKVLQFGDAGMSAGFGGCYFVPACAETEGYMRSTFIYRVVEGANASNTGASLNLGVRNTLGEGPDMAAITYANLTAATADGQWFETVIEYCPTYALRINFAQLIWGDAIQVAQVKFESMINVPEDYEPVKATRQGTPEELGIANGSSSISAAAVAADSISINGRSVSASAQATIYTATGAKVATIAEGQSIELAAGLYVANVAGNGVKFVVK